MKEALRRAEEVAARLAEHAAEADREGTFPHKEWDWIEEAGLLAAPLPERRGGQGVGLGTAEANGANTGALLDLLRRLGRGNLSVGRLYEGHANALFLIDRFGTPEQQARFARDACAGRGFAVWNTEARDGVCLEPVGEGGYRLEGAKTFASGAGHLERPLITARLPEDHPGGGGWQMLVVRADEAETTVDRSWWTPVGMRASASYKIDFSGVLVSSDDFLGAPGDYHREPYFSGGAIRFAAVQLGGAEALLDLVRRHLSQAERTGDPHQRRRAGRSALDLEGARLVLARAATLFDAYPGGGSDAAPADAEAVIAYAHLARTATERACQQVLERAERSIGARGMLQPHPLERLARDLTVYLRQPAPDAALDDLGRYVLEAGQGPAHRLWTPKPPSP